MELTEVSNKNRTEMTKEAHVRDEDRYNDTCEQG